MNVIFSEFHTYTQNVTSQRIKPGLRPEHLAVLICGHCLHQEGSSSSFPIFELELHIPLEKPTPVHLSDREGCTRKVDPRKNANWLLSQARDCLEEELQGTKIVLE